MKKKKMTTMNDFRYRKAMPSTIAISMERGGNSSWYLLFLLAKKEVFVLFFLVEYRK